MLAFAAGLGDEDGDGDGDGDSSGEAQGDPHGGADRVGYLGGGEDGDDDDDGDGDGDGDVDPEDTRVDVLQIELRNLRVIGDTGSAMTSPSVFLDWPVGSTDCHAFVSAPPGTYAEVKAEVDRYRVEGTLVVDDRQRRFIIDDTSPGELSISLNVGSRQVETDMTTVIGINLDTYKWVSETDWEGLADATGDEGTLVIDSSSGGLIAAVRAALLDEIATADVGALTCPSAELLD
ncbi:MAG: hypothetical protein AAGC55_14800 [Myxococcota bacterium]